MTYGVTWGEGAGVSFSENVTTATLLVVGSDQTNSTTSFVAITDLGFPVVGGSTYLIEATLMYNTSATTEGCDFALDGPAGPTVLSAAINIASSATAQRNAVITSYNTSVGATTSLGATSLPASVRGTVTPSNDGTLSISFRSETGAPQSVTVLSGSYAILRRLA